MPTEAQEVYNLSQEIVNCQKFWKTRRNLLSYLRNQSIEDKKLFVNAEVDAFDVELINAIYKAFINANNSGKRDLMSILRRISLSNEFINTNKRDISIYNLNVLVEKLAKAKGQEQNFITKAIIEDAIKYFNGKVEGLLPETENHKTKIEY